MWIKSIDSSEKICYNICIESKERKHYENLMPSKDVLKKYFGSSKKGIDTSEKIWYNIYIR